MKVIILSQNEKIYEASSEDITFPGKEGQFEVLKNHAPSFILLGEGEIVLKEKERVKKIPIFSGLVEILGNQITVLVKQPK